MDPQELDDAITERAEAAFSFLERLVAAPSTVGREHEAQGVVEQELKRLGFEVERLPIPDGIATTRSPAFLSSPTTVAST